MWAIWVTLGLIAIGATFISVICCRAAGWDNNIDAVKDLSEAESDYN